MHPVCRSDKEVTLERISERCREMENSRMLEEAADNRSDANSFASARNTRPKTTKAAHDQIDGYACRSCLAQRIDQFGILELVHLGDDARGQPGPLIRRLTPD